jgi:hypothetical protein
MARGIKYNYKSDFDFVYRQIAGYTTDGKPIFADFPDYDFKLVCSTGFRSYSASYIGGVCTNLFNDNGKIHVVCNDHNLGVGKLHIEFTALLPNGIYPDGTKKTVTAEPIDIELINGRPDNPKETEVEMILPYIKGEDGKDLTYDSMTEEAKRDLASRLNFEFEYDEETKTLNIVTR